VITDTNSEPEVVFGSHEIIKIVQKVMEEIKHVNPAYKPNYKTYEDQIEGEFRQLQTVWYEAAALHLKISGQQLKLFLDIFYEKGPMPLLVVDSSFAKYKEILDKVKKQSLPYFIAADYY
jgi:hypothetical protein